MEAYKVAGGALAGIGAVAALPVMGPIGTVSLVGAIAGGTLGGVAGAVASEIEDDQVRDPRRSVWNDAEEEEQEKNNPWLLGIEALREELDSDALGDLVVMLHAMERCARRRTASLPSLQEPDWIRDVGKMVDCLQLPDKTREEIEQLDEKPTTLQQIVEKTLHLPAKAREKGLGLLEALIPGADDGNPLGFGRNQLEIVGLVKSLLKDHAPQPPEED